LRLRHGAETAVVRDPKGPAIVYPALIVERAMHLYRLQLMKHGENLGKCCEKSVKRRLNFV